MGRRVHYDAIIVGAGPAGGWAARTLAEAGMDVLVLEAGHSRRWMHARFLFERLRRRAGYRVEDDPHAIARQGIQSRCYAWQYHPRSFVDDIDNPYSTPLGKPFAWLRSRQQGGRILVPLNGLQFYRFSDLDLKAASGDGFGVDWPISYADLEPHYDIVERSIGLTGNRDDIAHLPNPVFGTSVEITPLERHLRAAIKEGWPDRTLIVRRTAPPPFPLSAAVATGRATVRSNAIAREVVVDAGGGHARGVTWLEDGKESFASARVVVLAASTIESTRLLLNSPSARHPDGLANSSGTLGRFLMDHTTISSLTATTPLPSPMLSPKESFAYIPQFRNVGGQCEAFRRGYGVQLWSGGNVCSLTIRGEMLPRADNRVTIDPHLRDRWGIPSVRIDCEYSANEVAQSADAVAECRTMLTAAGFEPSREESVLGTPGLAIHECGTARMGDDPETSVLNSYNQSWDVSNLFVVDGAAFVSQGVQNPTLTIMALAHRAAEHIVDACRRREL